MQRFKITKRLEFCYGHRLINYQGKCKYLHGHNALLEIDIGSDHLNFKGMVADFIDIGHSVKEWLDKNIDHKLLLNKQDPIVEALTKCGEPIFLLDANPTAENIAKLIFDELRKIGISVSEIRLWETTDSCAHYRG